jgi:hypothetical protein
MIWICIILLVLVILLIKNDYISSYEGTSQCSLIIKVHDGVPALDTINDDFEDRGNTVFNMVEKTYSKYGQRLTQNTTLCMSADDIPRDNVTYQIVSGKKIPCWSFTHWDGAGLPRFHEDFYLNYKPEPFESKEDTMFWIGNLSTHSIRGKLKNEFGSKEGYKIYGIGETQFTTMNDHGKYKYLIDVSGRGYSARLKFLFLLNSVVFVVSRENTEYWHDFFEPWVHYVPVESDLSNLDENYEIMKNNQEKCKKMASDAREKALEVFSEDAVYEYYANILSGQKEIFT